MVAIVAGEAKAAVAEAPSPWRTAGWMPVGRRQRRFIFRHGQGGEHKVTLHYGSGPPALSIGGRDLAYTSSPGLAGGFDLRLHGIKSHVVAARRRP